MLFGFDCLYGSFDGDAEGGIFLDFGHTGNATLRVNGPTNLQSTIGNLDGATNSFHVLGLLHEQNPYRQQQPRKGIGLFGEVLTNKHPIHISDAVKNAEAIYSCNGQRPNKCCTSAFLLGKTINSLLRERLIKIQFFLGLINQ